MKVNTLSDGFCEKTTLNFVNFGFSQIYIMYCVSKDFNKNAKLSIIVNSIINLYFT